MTADEFEARAAALEEHLVSPTAEDLLREAEELFAAEGDTSTTRLALGTAKHMYFLDERRKRQREIDARHALPLKLTLVTGGRDDA